MCLLMFVTLSACASIILFDHFTAPWLHNLPADLSNLSLQCQLFVTFTSISKVHRHCVTYVTHLVF